MLYQIVLSIDATRCIKSCTKMKKNNKKNPISSKGDGSFCSIFCKTMVGDSLYTIKNQLHNSAICLPQNHGVVLWS